MWDATVAVSTALVSAATGAVVLVFAYAASRRSILLVALAVTVTTELASAAVATLE